MDRMFFFYATLVGGGVAAVISVCLGILSAFLWRRDPLAAKRILVVASVFGALTGYCLLIVFVSVLGT